MEETYAGIFARALSTNKIIMTLYFFVINKKTIIQLRLCIEYFSNLNIHKEEEKK